MNNAPQVKIQYLVNYDLEISGQDGVSGLDTSDLNPLSDLSNINNQDAQLRGKKGLHLSGGSVDEFTGEVSGTLLDGTYTFYADTQNAYKGIMGNELSNNNYEFDNPQYITIKAKNENTYIRSLLIYFDPVATEYATEISFSNAKKYDPNVTENNGIVADTSITSAKTYKNDRLVFLHNFGENSTLTQVQVNINKWSKKNSLMKILKIVTGYTGVYDKTNLMKFDFTINKTNDAQQLRFGVSSNNCTVDVLDKDLMIDTLYQKDLIYKNIKVQILVDGITQGIFYINEKSSEKGSNEWVFDCIDRLELLKEIKRPMMPIATRDIYSIVTNVLNGISFNVLWENEAKKYCEIMQIENSYFNANQSLYNLLLKCCQVGLLRIYIDRNNFVNITSGLNSDVQFGHNIFLNLLGNTEDDYSLQCNINDIAISGLYWDDVSNVNQYNKNVRVISFRINKENEIYTISSNKGTKFDTQTLSYSGVRNITINLTEDTVIDIDWSF